MVSDPQAVFLGMAPKKPSSTDVSDRIEAEALDWIVRLNDEAAGPAERVAFAAWRAADPRHAEAYREVAGLWSGLDDLPISEKPARPSRPHRWAAAGVALALVGALASAPGLTADARSGVGQLRSLTLADGTQVMLDADTALDVDITSQSRTVRLIRGRAWFRVAHEAGRPFVVRAGAGSVRDIGTAFEVARYGDAGLATVEEGVVELTVADGPALRLTEGQGARFGRGRAGPARPAARGRDWRSGRLRFEDAPLEEVLADLERYGAGLPVVLDEDLRARRITGALDPSRPGEALAAALARVGARADRVGPIVLVRKTG